MREFLVGFKSAGNRAKNARVFLGFKYGYLSQGKECESSCLVLKYSLSYLRINSVVGWAP